jgi:predicted Ser/Thr protein kinase
MPVDTGPGRISRYEIQRLIARGGMGRVYLAQDPNTSRQVVVKLMDATLESSDVRDRFAREARSLASLSHPGIVRIYDYGNFQDSPFIVMEYIRGDTLEEKIKQRAPLSVPQKLRLMSEVCAGLAHAHASGIIHRDVKPANLIVDQDGRVKILDFGIARVSDSNLTRGYALAGAGKVQIGTPGYMSPEQTRGDDIDQRTDIFAVGAVGYELLAYRQAFGGATIQEIERKVMHAPPEPLARLVPDLDAEIDRILARAMARDPNDRYQHATALEEAFEQCRLRLDPSKTVASAHRPRAPVAAVARPPESPADAAYARAAAAYEEKAYDVARRFAIEALAEDPAHPAARALLTRLDSPAPAPPPATRPAWTPRQVSPVAPAGSPRPGSRGRASEAISVDPTVLIDRASLSSAPPNIEPTMVIQRDDLRRHMADAGQPAAAPPSSRGARPAPDPTVVITRPARSGSAPAKPASSKGSSLQALWLRVKGVGRSPTPAHAGRSAKTAAPRPRAAGGVSPTTRGALLVIGALAVASLLVLGAIQLAGWFRTPGQPLLLIKPSGGTIVGAGLRCGTRGTACTTSRPVGEPVEFQGEPDEGYAFSGFTGDCAPTGRMIMTEARSCGATFTESKAVSALMWPLTITKPTGGTIVGAPDILCGTLGSTCAGSVPDGQPVTLRAQADPGYSLNQFTGDCDASGAATMTAARTCGATFLENGGVNHSPEPPPTRGKFLPIAPDKEKEKDKDKEKPPAVAKTEPNKTEPKDVTPLTPGQKPATTTQEPPVTPTDDKAAPLKTADVHAREEIEQLVKNYCAELETLDPERVRKLFPLADRRALTNQFKEYKTLKCSITAPKFDRIDSSPSGGAQVKADMKQVIEMKVGGAPKTYETIATIVVSRMSFQSPWLIDRVNHVAKPKP